ncbi:MAG: hypothetical protein HY318_09260 [Armatimonadetes bacterium]|nr:hypothetical protein [Armatimonadota bacterium]
MREENRQRECETALMNLHREAEGEVLEAETRGLLEEHLTGCTDCRRAREELRILSEALLAALPQTVACDFSERVRARLASPKLRWKQRCFALLVHPMMQVAAVGGLASLIAWIALSPTQSLTMPLARIAFPQVDFAACIPSGAQVYFDDATRNLSMWGHALTAPVAGLADWAANRFDSLRAGMMWPPLNPSWWLWVGFALALVANVTLRRTVPARETGA